MKNYIQPGGTLELPAPYDVASGGGALIGTIFGVAVATVANGALGQFVTEGVYDLPKTAGDTPAPGAKVYWNNSTKAVTTTASGNTLIGVQAGTAASASGDATVRVRLNGSAA